MAEFKICDNYNTTTNTNKNDIKLQLKMLSRQTNGCEETKWPSLLPPPIPQHRTNHFVFATVGMAVGQGTTLSGRPIKEGLI